MPTPTHEAYRDFVLRWFRRHAEDAEVAAQLERHADAARVLWELDLEAARPVLGRCYAPSPRGGEPRDPILMLRCLLLALLVGQPSKTKWVRDLRSSRVLRVLCGLDPDEATAGVGTFYDFLHRLHDGPIRKTCEHVEQPSEGERRRSRSPRGKASRPGPARLSKAEKRERRRLRRKSPASAPASSSPSSRRQPTCPTPTTCSAASPRCCSMWASWYPPVEGCWATCATCSSRATAARW
jgi:hypothetical protein